jgi:cyanuric acid amidohydrolase
MAPINILKFGVFSPSDTSPLKELRAADYDEKYILGVVGKSEGEYLPLSGARNTK